MSNWLSLRSFCPRSVGRLHQLAEDRQLAVDTGYEAYRFGGAELSDEEQGRRLLNAFLDDRLQRI